MRTPLERHNEPGTNTAAAAIHGLSRAVLSVVQATLAEMDLQDLG
ncbi:MAG: hypothetical protein QOD93_2466 [Acetobacteraceae bacterium]|jgi:hypothetical protein|nr:hypothetical protein [Acetobacteraceae bacterium]MEA2769504.1 hypothetical protein [Acetobacteraceae bacterium]